MPPRRNLPSRECGRLPQANHTEGAPFLRVLCARVGPETDRTTGFWLAQRRGPQHARFWRDGVERFTAAITGLFSATALAAEGRLRRGTSFSAICKAGYAGQRPQSSAETARPQSVLEVSLCGGRWPMLWRRGAPAFNRARLPNSTAIAAGPSLAAAAAIDPRSGNMLRSLPRISRAELALHKRPQTDERRGQPLPPQQSPLGRRLRTQPIARSSPRRSPRTSGSAGNGRNPPLPIAAAEPSGPVCRVPSTRSPRCSAGRQQIPTLTEAPPAIANALCPPFPRGNRATAAAARTTSRRTPRLLPAKLAPLAIAPRARPLELSQTLHPSQALRLHLLSHYPAIPATCLKHPIRHFQTR